MSKQFFCEACNSTMLMKSKPRHLRSAKHARNTNQPQQITEIVNPTEEQVVEQVKKFQRQLRELKKQRDEYVEKHRDIYIAYLEKKQKQESEPEPEVEVKSEQESEPQPEPEVEVKSEQESEPQPEVEVEVKSEQESEPQPEVEVEVEVKSEQESEPEPEVEVEVKSEQESEPEPIIDIIRKIKTYDSEIQSNKSKIYGIKKRKTLSVEDKHSAIQKIIEVLEKLQNERNTLITDNQEYIDKHNKQVDRTKEAKKRKEHPRSGCQLIRDKMKGAKPGDIITINRKDLT